MRVTFNMMSQRVLRDIMSTSERLMDAQTRASSGKRILKPSDDVSGTGRALSLRSSLNDIAQYLTNSDMVKSQLGVTSSAMDKIVSLVSQVQNKAMEAGNGAANAEASQAIANELDEISNSLVAAGNTQFSGKYIFAGSMTDQQPIIPSADPAVPYSYNGNSTVMSVQISPWTTANTNVLGSAVFNMGSSAAPGSPDIFSTIKLLKDEVLAGNVTAVSARLGDIKANLDNVIALRSEVGAKMNTLDSANNSLLDSKGSLSELLSKTEDCDVADAILNLQMRENMYQAAVSTASRVLNLSLADFLK